MTPSFKGTKSLTVLTYTKFRSFSIDFLHPSKPSADITWEFAVILNISKQTKLQSRRRTAMQKPRGRKTLYETWKFVEIIIWMLTVFNGDFYRTIHWTIHSGLRQIALIAVISGLTCKRGERVNSDPLASFVCRSKQRNIWQWAQLR